MLSLTCLLFLSLFVNGVISDKGKIESCFIDEIPNFFSENYDALIDKAYSDGEGDKLYNSFLEQCVGDECDTTKEEFFKEFKKTQEEMMNDPQISQQFSQEMKEGIDELYVEIDKNLDIVKEKLFLGIIIVGGLLLVIFGIVFLINRNLFQTIFEVSLVGFFGSLFSLIFFKGFLLFQSFLLSRSFFDSTFDSFTREFVLFVFQCILSESLNYFFFISLIASSILLVMSILFYFLNRKSST